MKPILESLGLVTKGNEKAWAVTSPDDTHRYILGRTWDEYFSDSLWFEKPSTRELWVFGMMNPSKARHDIDDPTVRKVTGFSKRGGAGGFIIINMSAYSCTDPMEMVEARKRGVNVVGEHNAAVFDWALSRPATVGRHIAAWGKIPKAILPLCMSSILRFKMSKPDCFGVNQDGSPKHPLKLSYDTPLIPFN
jgi:hypothetical protein